MRPQERRAAGTRSRQLFTTQGAQGSLLEAGKRTGGLEPSSQTPSSWMPMMMILLCAHPCPTSAPRRRGASNSCASEKRSDARVRGERQLTEAPRGCASGGPVAPGQGRARLLHTILLRPLSYLLESRLKGGVHFRYYCCCLLLLLSN